MTGDGSGGGRMTMKELRAVLSAASGAADVVGYTIAEDLPFDEERLSRILAELTIFAK